MIQKLFGMKRSERNEVGRRIVCSWSFGALGVDSVSTDDRKI